MNIENTIKEYYHKREIFDKANLDFEKTKNILRPNITEILKKYSYAEHEIYKKYNNFHTIYNYHVAFGDFDDFEILKETENYILLDCWYHYDGEDYSSIIKLPKNLDEIDLYVEKFINEIESNLLMNKLANK